MQTVPATAVNDDLGDVTEWLGAAVRIVDSSLLDEWERLLNPDAEGAVAEVSEAEAPTAADLTANRRAFGVLVRNEVFAWVELLARRAHGDLAARLADRGGAGGWTVDALDEAMAPYWAEHDSLAIDAEARATRWAVIDDDARRITQTLLDPAGHREWVIEAEIDLPESRARQQAAVLLRSIRRL